MVENTLNDVGIVNDISIHYFNGKNNDVIIDDNIFLWKYTKLLEKISNLIFLITRVLI